MIVRASSALCLAALLLAGCGSTAEEDKSDAIEVVNGAGTVPAGPAPEETRGQEFVSAVLGQLDFAAASARQVADRGEPAPAKQAAQKLAATMQAARDELTSIATAGGLKLEPAPGPAHQADLALLSSTRGQPLAQAFAQQQMDGLTLLVGTVRAYKNGGDNAGLRAWAEKHQGPINDRLLDMQTLKGELEQAALPADQR